MSATAFKFDIGRMIEAAYPVESLLEGMRHTERILRRWHHAERVKRHGDPRFVALFPQSENGNGNAFRRRRGQRAVFRPDREAYRSPECECSSTHILTWLDPSGTVALPPPSKPLAKRPRLPL